MSYLDHDGLAYFKSKLDRTFIADIVFDDGDILLYGGDGTLLKTVVQEGTVTQKKSTTNKEYPILLCWDADAEEDQTMKTVWYGLDARINPKFGYLYARRYYTEHPSYERTNAPTARAEWHHMFTDAVSAPMGEVYEYLDRIADGGEHRMELRIYGNPLSQYVDTPNHNEATDAVSIGVGATKGEKLTFFGYCPSTPIYLENGTTMRKSTVRGDQYGKDIITRDWLNLNGSITGLVHTYMDETIDGYKTFLKTVTINSGDNNNKAGLYVQGDANLHSNVHVYGNETVDGKLTANGTAEIKGGSGNTPSLTVTGNEYISGNSNIHGNLDVDGNANIDGTTTLDGNVHMLHNLDVDGNANIDGNETVGGTLTATGKITGNNGLKITGNTTTDSLTVNNNATVGGTLGVTGATNLSSLAVSGNETVGGTLTVTGKITGNGGAEISGGNGLKVNGNETITGNLTVGGTTTTEDLSVTDDATIGDDLTVNGDANVAGTINKKSGNTTQEYVTYVVNQNDTRKNIAAGLADTSKGLGYDSTTGKLYVKTGNGITYASGAIAANLKANGGINFSNGQMYVDFSSATDDTKDDILSSLGMQIPLTGNKTFYVNKGHSAATTTWRNSQGVIDKTVGTANKPFKTIQSAIDCATQGYSIGSYHIDIIVTKSSDAGYNESISLPQFQHTTGYIEIKSANTSSASNYAVITNKATTLDDKPARPIGGLFSCNGTGWYLTQLKLDSEITNPNDGVAHFPTCISSGTGGSVAVKGCAVSCSYSGAAPNGTPYIRMFSATSGGVIAFQLLEDVQPSISASIGNNTSLTVFFAERNGQINFNATNSGSSSSSWHKIACSGSCSCFARAAKQSLITTIGGATYDLEFSGSMTGSKCDVDTGSAVSFSADCPGNSAGTCDSSTYCWVKPSSLLS